MLGNLKLTTAQIENMLFEIEAVINSQPLTYMSQEDNDLELLRLAHFLTELPNLTLIEIDFLLMENMRKRFKLVSQVAISGRVFSYFASSQTSKSEKSSFLGRTIHAVNFSRLVAFQRCIQMRRESSVSHWYRLKTGSY